MEDYFASQLDKYLSVFHKTRDDLHVHLILNRQSSIPNIPENEKVKLYLRGLSEAKSADLITRFESENIEVSLYDGDLDFIERVINRGRFTRKKYEFVYQAGVSKGGSAQRCLIPTFCSHFGLKAMNSDASSRALIWHKYIGGKVLEHFEINTPKSYLYHPKKGWKMGETPAEGMKVIAKSTYEAYAVGVDDESVFNFSYLMEEKLADMSRSLGQPITVQEFIPGEEVYIPVLELDQPLALPPQRLCISGIPVTDNKILKFMDNVNKSTSFSSYEPYDTELTNKLKNIAVKAFHALHQSGISRVDVRVTDQGKVYIIDQAEVPSLSRHHAFNKGFLEAGGAESQLVPMIIASNIINIS